MFDAMTTYTGTSAQEIKSLNDTLTKMALLLHEDLDGIHKELKRMNDLNKRSAGNNKR